MASATATIGGDFVTRLYARLAATSAGENLFLSPFSIRVALAMCAAGARGRTRLVLAELIDAPQSVDEQNRQYAKILKAIHGAGKRSFELTTANALWGQQGYRFQRDYQEALADWEEAGARIWGTVPERVAIAAGPERWLAFDGIEAYRDVWRKLQRATR